MAGIPLSQLDLFASGALKTAPKTSAPSILDRVRFRISQGYNPTPDINNPLHHPAIDIAPYEVVQGKTVKVPATLPIGIDAPSGGRVTREGFMPGGYGNYLYVTDPQGYQLRFGHLSTPTTLQLGEQVSSGELLGLMGSTGRSTGEHLHFEVRSPGGGYYDPLQYLSSHGETVSSLFGGASVAPTAPSVAERLFGASLAPSKGDTMANLPIEYVQPAKVSVSDLQTGFALPTARTAPTTNVVTAPQDQGIVERAGAAAGQAAGKAVTSAISGALAPVQAQATAFAPRAAFIGGGFALVLLGIVLLFISQSGGVREAIRGAGSSIAKVGAVAAL